MANSNEYLEDFIKDKNDIGAQYSFQPKSLELKSNQYNYRGVFVARDFKEGDELISVPQRNGSITPFRAFEEAQDLLEALGPSRFNLDNIFVITCAAYLRFANAKTRDSDIAVTVTDLKETYAGTPMSATDSIEKARLLFKNNKLALEMASLMEERIKLMKVDPDLFRAALGYVRSRCWGDNYGLIPVLDMFNAAYGDTANCQFMFQEGRYVMSAIKDIKAGSELVWSYNSADAVTTWFGYGYVDGERPTKTTLLVRLTDEQRTKFEQFSVEKLAWRKSKISPSYKLDKNEFEFTLLAPGEKSPNIPITRHTISQCMSLYSAVRVSFRAILLSQSDKDFGEITTNKLETNVPVFGLDFEREVVTAILEGLKDGLTETQSRVKKFNQSEVGSGIDMSSYIQLTHSCADPWIEALTHVQTMCGFDDIQKCIPVINTALNLDIQTVDEIGARLTLLDQEQPSLTAAILSRYISGRMTS